jgi:hypothetical protein
VNAEKNVSEYRKALDLSLPIEIQHALEAQGLEITAAHDKVRRLREFAKGRITWL